MIAHPVICIVGQTASGKSGLAMELAKLVPCEIICADSQTVRRGLNIGTAKPSLDDQVTVPHHMLDLIDPYQQFSVAEFKQRTEQLVAEIRDRGAYPLIVGGTGLYVDAYAFDFDLEPVEAHEATISAWEQLSVTELHRLISQRGLSLPENQQNKRHLVGVLRRGGIKSKNIHIRPGVLMYGLQRSDEELKARIIERVKVMFEAGFLDEYRAIIECYGPPPKSFDAIGYAIAQRYFAGEINEQEMKDQFVRSDWQYARRQRAWFKRNKNIQWFTESAEALKKIVHDIK